MCSTETRSAPSSRARSVRQGSSNRLETIARGWHVYAKQCSLAARNRRPQYLEYAEPGSIFDARS
jgi:hypothetical protein